MVSSNVILGPWFRTEFFANFGTGFHSNDARAVVLDPNGTALPTALGYEFGIKSRPHPRVDLSATYFVLDLDSELVFVGDEGTTEASRPSRRQGLALTARVRLLDWLSFSGDITLTRARFDNGDAVPLAPRLTARAELTARLPWGPPAWRCGRWVIATRPRTGSRLRAAIRSSISPGAIATSGSRTWRTSTIARQFYFTSRLNGEPAAGVADTHFTPGNPRTFLGGLAVRY